MALHLIVKLHLNLLNFLFSMFLVSFSSIVITVCYITKFEIFLYLTTLLLCGFLTFLSMPIFYSNFSRFSKFIFIKSSFTNYLSITSFIDVVILAHTLAPTWRYRNQPWTSKRKDYKFILLSLEL